MSAQNPFIDELCKGTEYTERASYSFNYLDKKDEWKVFYITPPGFLIPKDKEESENILIDPLDLL